MRKTSSMTKKLILLYIFVIALSGLIITMPAAIADQVVVTKKTSTSQNKKTVNITIRKTSLPVNQQTGYQAPSSFNPHVQPVVPATPTYNPDYLRWLLNYPAYYSSQLPPSNIPTYNPDYFRWLTNYPAYYSSQLPPSNIPTYNPDYLRWLTNYPAYYNSQLPPTNIPTYNPDYLRWLTNYPAYYNSQLPPNTISNIPPYTPSGYQQPAYTNPDYTSWLYNYPQYYQKSLTGYVPNPMSGNADYNQWLYNYPAYYHNNLTAAASPVAYAPVTGKQSTQLPASGGNGVILLVLTAASIVIMVLFFRAFGQKRKTKYQLFS